MYWRSVMGVEVVIASAAALSKVAISNGHCIVLVYIPPLASPDQLLSRKDITSIQNSPAFSHGEIIGHSLWNQVKLRGTSCKITGILYEHVKSSHANFQLLFVLVSFGGNFPENSENWKPENLLKTLKLSSFQEGARGRQGCEGELRMKGRGLVVKMTRKWLCWLPLDRTLKLPSGVEIVKL